jgi:hypothetical protein
MTVENAATFISGKNATFTVRSLATGKHYTFKSKKIEDSKGWCMFVLHGPDQYLYVGLMTEDDHKLIMTRKSRFRETDSVVRALRWCLHQVFVRCAIPADLEVMHEGTCGNCGRRLTHPDSLESGFGPECVRQVRKCEAAAVAAI